MSDQTMKFYFDSEKAVDVICYIADQAPHNELYYVGKILYFADKLHLERYGRSICGDTYIAMEHGPVPSGTYDLIKDVRDHRVNSPHYDHANASFQVQGRKVTPIRPVDEDLFSDSDILCLQEAINVYGTQSFEQLKRKTHDAVWESADLNGEIAVEDLIRSLSNGDLLLDYLKEQYQIV